MNNTGVYIKLLDEDVPIFISMTREALQSFKEQLKGSNGSGFLTVKTAKYDKHYNFRYIKEITIQGAN